jgi:hypothetical protein
MKRNSVGLWTTNWILLGVALVFGTFGLVSYVWDSSGRVADNLNVHRYCFTLSAATCTSLGLTSASNLTGIGSVMVDMNGHTLSHRFWLDNTGSDLIEPLEELTINGPRSIDFPLTVAAFLPSDSTSLDVTVDDLTNEISGTYRLKIAGRDDLDLARAFVKFPNMYYVVLSTTAVPTGAICGIPTGECRVAYPYDHLVYP